LAELAVAAPPKPAPVGRAVRELPLRMTTALSLIGT
jgi:hypothetical protein